LKEKAHEEETTRLIQLKKELENEFGQDLWEEAMGAKLGGKGTTEDLYWWYKKKCNQSYTKSELQIRGIL